MSKAQILFTTEDKWGMKSNTDINFENHSILKNGDVNTDKFYPRGKAYWKLFNTQTANENVGEIWQYE